MIEYMYIAPEAGCKQPSDYKVLMSTETSCHLGHLLLVSNPRLFYLFPIQKHKDQRSRFTNAYNLPCSLEIYQTLLTPATYNFSVCISFLLSELAFFSGFMPLVL